VTCFQLSSLLNIFITKQIR